MFDFSPYFTRLSRKRTIEVTSLPCLDEGDDIICNEKTNLGINLLELPKEILCEILNKLSIEALNQVSKTCRMLYFLIKEQNLWNRHCPFRIRPSQLQNSQRLPFIFGNSKPEARLCHVAMEWNGCMYIHGGHNVLPGSQHFQEVKADFFMYDFKTKRWRKMTAPHCPAKTEHSSIVYENKLFLFGGFNGLGFTNSVWSFDFFTETWSEVQTSGEIPPQRSAHVATLYKNGMYVFGGWNGVQQFNDFYRLDLDTFMWSKVNVEGVIPSARCSHTACSSEKLHKMFVFGGCLGKNYSNELCIFDFETHTWEIHISPLSSPRSRMKMLEWNDKLYILGGWNRHTHFGDFFEVDLSSMNWKIIEAKTTKELEERRIGQHSMVLFQNTMYIFGGFNQFQNTSTKNFFGFYLTQPKIEVSPS